jgi:hypothetical protein
MSWKSLSNPTHRMSVRFLTVDALAHCIGCHPDTIRRAIANKTLQACRLETRHYTDDRPRKYGGARAKFRIPLDAARAYIMMLCQGDSRLAQKAIAAVARAGSRSPLPHGSRLIGDVPGVTGPAECGAVADGAEPGTPSLPPAEGVGQSREISPLAKPPIPEI